MWAYRSMKEVGSGGLIAATSSVERADGSRNADSAESAAASEFGRGRHARASEESDTSSQAALCSPAEKLFVQPAASLAEPAITSRPNASSTATGVLTGFAST